MDHRADTSPANPGGTVLEISAEECFRLLATQPVGRLAVSAPDGPPLVVPVNYRLDGKAIVFRSDPGLKVSLLRRAPVSFEVDSIDTHQRGGWSVLAHGVAYEATHWETDHLDLESWVRGSKRTWVRILVTSITGRRLLAADLDLSGISHA